MREFNLNGITLTDFESLENCASYIVSNPGIYISLGAESLVNNTDHLKGLSSMNYCHFFADGEGAVLATRRLYSEKIKKISGCELWLEVVKHAGNRKIALVGSKENVIELVHKKLLKEFDAKVVYAHDGYFSNEDKIISDILSSRAEFLFLALGQPRQELLANKIFSINNKITIIPVGGSFDVYAGLVKRAPKILIKLKLEWAYRLWKEPQRIKRQTAIPKLLLMLIFNKFVRC
ncbi:TPA: WecB/TagA/CpsF family glycosyltransferase [Vibrio cholerae]|uniref:WecB/TagA/CpsF family glycosyltransferase n=1 Tax=Vibrio cholerae TaxID=666 RepID=UPI00129BC0E2|nr:WecB/TagA/CpsF family glycosyltransferase [Vibrio cholerae]EGR4218108.1 glycosyltransferase [Vibrio cholerae]EGR4253099.1 glycosyltransferase [Vibrio cholerae]ELJ8609057.1 WecB/TagA/CpsF family glycosyltransferase [Vibrio cholerae]MRI14733.1 glycosyltransferase [Vibrio cholerae]NOF41824.1 WecB/TagA/CpsF family glycosyltransferase [Vibrio cholerae]